MTRPSNQPGEGQLDFDGGVVQPPRPVQPERPRNALARTLTPEYMGLNEMDFMDVTSEMVTYVQPDRLRPYLIDVPLDAEKSPSAVSYTDRTGTGFRERNIAVTEAEAKLLPRFMVAIQRNAAINAGAKVTTPLPNAADIARKARAKLHVQEGKLPKVEEYRQMLLTQRQLLDKYIVASNGHNAGLSHFGKEGTMRERFAYLQTFIIGDMVRAYGTQRNLTEADMKMVAKAVTVSIIFNPERIGNFHQLVKFLREYNGHKLELAEQRIDSMRRSIGRTATQS